MAFPEAPRPIGVLPYDRQGKMMQQFRIAASVTAFVLVSACHGETALRQKILGGTTTPFKDCSPKNEAGIRIWLPADLDFSSLTRNVDYIDAPVPDDNEYDKGEPNDGPPAAAGSPPPFVGPFNIHTWKMKGKRWILVKVIIPNNSSYRFYESPEGDVKGVGSSDGNAGAVLCGIRDIKGNNKPGSTKKKVASFFLDIKALNKGKKDSFFNIAVIPNAFPDTPIFIDPKIYNEG